MCHRGQHTHVLYPLLVPRPPCPTMPLDADDAMVDHRNRGSEPGRSTPADPVTPPCRLSAGGCAWTGRSPLLSRLFTSLGANGSNTPIAALHPCTTRLPLAAQ
mmetsp:Transcript_27499/g.62234  ORF Transcript_27499/g.62234 Transcript_27499/m.62234 type:complete len:103 (-) Transcript_27499:1308-1616(-)